jgi:hypothetical protein
LLFRSNSQSGGNGLWVSDGTIGGTFEIGGALNAGVTGGYVPSPNQFVGTAGGLAPNGIVAIGSKALFEGTDSTGTVGLWVTDGTAAGTIELGGLKNAGLNNVYFAGLGTYQITAFGNKAIFTGTDADDHQGLWVSDGTAAGNV